MSDALAADPNASPYMAFPNDTNLSNAFLHPFGLSLADHAAQTAALPPEAELQACLDWFLAADAGSMNGWQAGFVQQVRGLNSKWNALCRNVTLAQPSTLPDAEDYRQFDAAYTMLGETMRVLAIPTFADPSTYAATVTACGVLPAGASNPDAGYALLRSLLDWPESVGFGFPVRKEATQAVLSEIDRPYTAQLESIFDNLGTAYLYESWLMENDLYAYVQDSAYAKTGENFAGLAASLASRVNHY